ncbi:hypothetical protein GS610_11585 [Ruegeria sp. HKCCD6228]|uniref:Uncharacterized protein n=1 Tax=Ruegeria atlantica TaxID=81569 RepID=A0AA90YUT2_9RHOB|nr:MULTISPECIES: hypothetical protein [Ruegeria]NOC83183.1 hypothetical protein [Ruegeria sp. HKCCD6428]NOC92360.1 hypothetical protein [Ruegeria sp. HKCCD6604]NOD97849.1 hypothetical protein [Ruegeria sp. HKCCD6228]NOE19628.1 hypothetical protein [Ruegeria atlantica]
MHDFLKLSTSNYYLNAEASETEEEFSARMAAEFEATVLEAGPDTIAAFLC